MSAANRQNEKVIVNQKNTKTVQIRGGPSTNNVANTNNITGGK